MESIRLGTIGTGMIVHEILNSVMPVNGISLEAVYSRSAEKAAQLSAEFSPSALSASERTPQSRSGNTNNGSVSCHPGAVSGAAKAYTDLPALLSDPDVNTIYIASPNILHYEQAKAALLAGKNVICEKPFVTRKCDAEELFGIADDMGLMLVEAAPTAYLPNYRVLRRELPKIGRIRLVMSNYSQYSSRYDALLSCITPNVSNLDPIITPNVCNSDPGSITPDASNSNLSGMPNVFNPAFGGGCLMDINYYNILLNVLLFGPPEDAAYQCNRFPCTSDTSGTAILKYDGFVSTNTGAKDTWGVNYFQIEGEDGFIYINGGSNGLNSVRVVTRDDDVTYDDRLKPLLSADRLKPSCSDRQIGSAHSDDDLSPADQSRCDADHKKSSCSYPDPEQPDPGRWSYEVNELTHIMLTNDKDALNEGREATIQTISLLEQLRAGAGIIFPTDAH